MTYRRRFENVGVLILVMVQTAKMRFREKQAKCLISLPVDEVGRVQRVQRKREREGHFRGDLASKSGHLVHSLPATPKAQDCATDARRGAEAPSVESASKRRETVPPENVGGGGGIR
jgi:hypothetical protein